ncbi:Protein smf [Chlamydiales bacterium SCGC AG-110-P3]|nr:Protein smf [Chlamydiales bacterium SCGC AG-110-P3]
MTISETQALIVLNNTPGLGPVKIRHLITHCGTPTAVLQASATALEQVPGIGSRIATAITGWQQSPTWHADIEAAERMDVEVIPYTDSRYPKRLLTLKDHPVLLYVAGTLTPADGHSIAVVGTRNATHYGREMAHQISKDLPRGDFTVISGLARGIDTAAHRGALDGKGRTIAVIGSGLAKLYPEENAGLAEMITQHGAVISEYPMLTPPDRQQFPQRNRIVSGLTLGTLLIEAPTRSGAMITMDRAETQGRRLFALPGRVDVETFRGNHLLIKSGRAQLIENGADIAEAFDSLFTAGQALSKPARGLLNEDERKLLELLPSKELPIDDIVNITKLPIMKLNVLLMSLIIKKQIKEFPGKIYKKTA